MKRMLSLTLLCLCSSPLFATTLYTGIDENGTTIFSDQPLHDVKSQQKLKVEDLPALEKSDRLSVLSSSEEQSTTEATSNADEIAIKQAKTSVEEARFVLAAMEKQDAESFAACEEKKAAINKDKPVNYYYLCQHLSLIEYKKAVMEAQAQLAKLETHKKPREIG